MADQSSYLKHLPAIYRQPVEGAQADFMDRFLKAFEKSLSGIPNEVGADPLALEEILDRGANFYDPNLTPAQMVVWLAGWVALEVSETDDWNRDLNGDPSIRSGDAGQLHAPYEQLVPFESSSPLSTRNRELIKSIVDLYRRRGTVEGLSEYLNLYTQGINFELRELLDPLQVGVTYTVGVNTMVGERPYYFQVVVPIPDPDPVQLVEFRRSIRDILNTEKPAHTFYDLAVDVASMSIGVNCTIKQDTLLGGHIVQRVR